MKINQWHTFARANSVCFSPSIFVDWTKMEKCSRLRKFFTGYGVNLGKLILIALRILTNDKCSKTFWKIIPSAARTCNRRTVMAGHCGFWGIFDTVYLPRSVSGDNNEILHPKNFTSWSQRAYRKSGNLPCFVSFSLALAFALSPSFPGGTVN